MIRWKFVASVQLLLLFFSLWITDGGRITRMLLLIFLSFDLGLLSGRFLVGARRNDGGDRKD
jgi:hypothetical protein